MPLMTNAEAFRYDFGISATELWTMTEEQFLEWLNADCDRERPNAVPVVRCKDCKWWNTDKIHKCVAYDAFWITDADDYCAWGERKNGQ